MNFGSGHDTPEKMRSRPRTNWAGMSGRSKTLDPDIHLQALNAIVKTAALGDEGATLTVLSIHVDSLYRKSRDIVASVVGLLEKCGQPHPRRVSAVRTSTRKSLGGSHAPGLKQIETAFTEYQTTLAAADELVAQHGSARTQPLAAQVFGRPGIGHRRSNQN